jgi:hypothetical protein
MDATSSYLNVVEATIPDVQQATTGLRKLSRPTVTEDLRT